MSEKYKVFQEMYPYSPDADYKLNFGNLGWIDADFVEKVLDELNMKAMMVKHGLEEFTETEKLVILLLKESKK